MQRTAALSCVAVPARQIEKFVFDHNKFELRVRPHAATLQACKQMLCVCSMSVRTRCAAVRHVSACTCTQQRLQCDCTNIAKTQNHKYAITTTMRAVMLLAAHCYVRTCMTSAVACAAHSSAVVCGCAGASNREICV